VCSRSLKATVLTILAAAIRIQMPRIAGLKITRRLSMKCWFLGHDDWIRRGPDRLYLECFECGRETRGWPARRIDHRAGDAGVHAGHMSKRNDHSASASVAPIRRSLSGERSLAHNRDLTIAASLPFIQAQRAH